MSVYRTIGPLVLYIFDINFTVLTEKQFQLLLRLRLDTCRRLWVHGLPGSGKTVLAVMMINYLVKHEGPVLFVAENEGLVLKLE